MTPASITQDLAVKSLARQERPGERAYLSPESLLVPLANSSPGLPLNSSLGSAANSSLGAPSLGLAAHSSPGSPSNLLSSSPLHPSSPHLTSTKQASPWTFAHFASRLKGKIKGLTARATRRDPLDAAAAAMSDRRGDKDKRPFDGDNVAGVTAALGALDLTKKEEEQGDGGGEGSKMPLDMDPDAVRTRERNLYFIGEALEMARLALRTNETPVGCVLVYKDVIIAKGMNATNVTRNGTRHAELMAISALLSVQSKTGPPTTSLKPRQLVEYKNAIAREAFENERREREQDKENEAPGSAAEGSSREEPAVFVPAPPPDEGNEDGSKGHLYPYGQKMLKTKERIHPAILKECVLYVTVEPCVMCASLLRQFGIRKVYFGAVNDKFGGTGGVFSIHANSLPVGAGGVSASAHPLPREPQTQLPDGSSTLGISYPPGGGDGGNVEPGFEIEGGWGRDEAVGLLRRFYVQENGRAPVPRKKEGRAARLAAMMGKDGKTETKTAELDKTEDGDKDRENEPGLDGDDSDGDECDADYPGKGGRASERFVSGNTRV